MSYLRYLHLIAYSDVKHIFCCVFVFCICIEYVVVPGKRFLYNGRERRPEFIGAVLNASSDFAHATVSGKWFQRMTVSTKKLF